MQLETAGRISSDHVTENELVNAFQDDKGREDFIILSKREQIYIQASGVNDDPYVIEYREGDDEHHFQSVNEVSKDTVLKTFLKYLKNDSSWKTDIEWERLELKNGPWWKIW